MRIYYWVLLGLLPLQQGCALLHEPSLDDDLDTPADGPPGVLHAEQRGDLGDVLGYESDAHATELRYSRDRLSIRLDSSGDAWWVMNRLDVRGLDLATAASYNQSWRPQTTRASFRIAASR